MSYAALSDVQAEFPHITFNSTTKVKDVDVTRFCDEADAEIDSKLYARYQTPITGTQSIVLMRMLEIWIVKDRIQALLQVKSPDPKTDQGGQMGLRDRAMKKLDALASGAESLTDAPVRNPSNGVKSYTNDNEIDHVFQQGVTQW